MTSAPVLRIVLTGSEATGKTALVQRLAEHFHAPWVAEYSRWYAETVGRPLGPEDVEPIALGQIALEDSALLERPALVFLDTDLVSTLIYARHYYGMEPAWLLTAARERMADLYLLLDIDIDWQADGIRDRSQARDEIQNLFREQLRVLHARVIDVQGSEEARFNSASQAVEALLREAAN